MPQKTCIFCKILRKEIPSTVIAENDHVMVIKDIAPKAPVHYLIFPKEHVKDIASLTDEQSDVAAHMALMARDLSRNLSGSQSFRLITNNGADSGQSVFHLHTHFLSGKKMLDF